MPVFGGKDINDVNRKVKEGREERMGKDDRAKIPKGGPVRLALTEVRYSTINAKKVPGSILHKITLVINVHGETDKYKPIIEDCFVECTPNEKQEYGMSDKAIDYGVSRLVGFFQTAFGFNTPNAADYNQLVAAYQRFMGQPFLAAVKYKKRYWIKDKQDGSGQELMEWEEPTLWYAGSIAEATKFSVPVGSHVEDYTEKEKLEIATFKRTLSSEPQSPDTEKGIGASLDDLPF